MNKLPEFMPKQIDAITDASMSVIDNNFYFLLELIIQQNPILSKEPLIEYYTATAGDIRNHKNCSFILFNIYRLSRNFHDKTLKNFECDCCKGATKLFKEIYPWLDDFICEPLPKTTMKYHLRQANTNILFKGDTMTSVFTPLKGYLKSIYQINRTSSPTEEWEMYWLNHLCFKEDLPEYVLDFIHYGYSFANFLPVPQGFNAGKSNFGKWDSWDLVLNQIYQWYQANPQTSSQTDDCALKELFRYARDAENTVLHCTEWLKIFHSWENFVEQNYMQAFVQPDGCPKKLFPNHTLENKLPPSSDEYEEFFKNMVSYTKERADSINKLLNVK